MHLVYDTRFRSFLDILDHQVFLLVQKFLTCQLPTSTYFLTFLAFQSLTLSVTTTIMGFFCFLLKKTMHFSTHLSRVIKTLSPAAVTVVVADAGDVVLVEQFLMDDRLGQAHDLKG